MSEPNFKKVVVYTAIVNNYETLQNPDYIDPRIQYICFTDQPIWLSLINDTVWEIKKIPRSSLDDTRKARQVKILPHIFLKEFDCDYSIWIDGNINIIDDIFELFNLYDISILGFKHHSRDCVYDELSACVDAKKDTSSTMQEQIHKYATKGLPKHSGLIETNVLIRKHTNHNVMKLMESWWLEIKAHSKRDQLSLPYVIWQQNFHIQTMGNDNARGNSKYFYVWQGWRTTPTKPKWQILWDKYAGWRIQK